VFAPMPRASTRIAVAVKPGERLNNRNACRKSCSRFMLTWCQSRLLVLASAPSRSTFTARGVSRSTIKRWRRQIAYLLSRRAEARSCGDRLATTVVAAGFSGAQIIRPPGGCCDCYYSCRSATSGSTSRRAPRRHDARDEAAGDQHDERHDEHTDVSFTSTSNMKARLVVPRYQAATAPTPSTGDGQSGGGIIRPDRLCGRLPGEFVAAGLSPV
jgi:hypothetical protein